VDRSVSANGGFDGESRFADDRTYTWQGKKVDEQTHLGFDLAKVAHAPVPAANDGKVIFADNLGIYGNCIVIDHGFGLQTIYGHMSQFEVKKGDLVKKGRSWVRQGRRASRAGIICISRCRLMACR